MTDVAIQEEYALPSGGLIYSTKFDPTVKLRSMTTLDEMKRLQSTDNPYKLMSEIIEGCLLTKLPVHVYDMCLGDYQYLLHKLRVITYGNEYKLSAVCPKCKERFDFTVDLDSLKVIKPSEDITSKMNIILPKTGTKVKLRFQTPRDLDNIASMSKEMQKNFPEMGDPTYLLTLESMIDTVNDEKMIHAMLLEWIKKLPMADTNYLSQKATKLNGEVGVDTVIETECPNCKNSVRTLFRFTNEFFGPAVD